jgi:hypothetical protein
MSETVVKTMDDIRVVVMDNKGKPIPTSSTARQCAYCDKPAKAYVWCREHMIEMARLRVNTRKLEVTQ